MASLRAALHAGAQSPQAAPGAAFHGAGRQACLPSRSRVVARSGRSRAAASRDGRRASPAARGELLEDRPTGGGPRREPRSAQRLAVDRHVPRTALAVADGRPSLPSCAAVASVL